MSKTKKDLLYALAEKIGGEHADRMRATLKKKTPFDDILDRPVSDEEFASQLAKMESDLQAALAKRKHVDWEKPGTWGLPN